MRSGAAFQQWEHVFPLEMTIGRLHADMHTRETDLI